MSAGGEGSRLAASRWARGVWLAAGLMFVGVGFVGIFLPVLPTTPFLILAAACFSRSSARLEGWLLRHPRFGPLLRDWRARGAIPRRAKICALLGTALGFGVFLWGGHGGPWVTVAVAAVMLGGVGYVFSRPS